MPTHDILQKSKQMPTNAFRVFARTGSSFVSLPATVVDDAESGVQLNEHKRSIVENFVRKQGGKRVIQRILIANNGMAATKSILSMRQWAYMNLGRQIFL